MHCLTRLPVAQNGPLPELAALCRLVMRGGHQFATNALEREVVSRRHSRPTRLPPEWKPAGSNRWPPAHYRLKPDEPLQWLLPKPQSEFMHNHHPPETVC
jgi:hypothetical protein